MLKAEHLSVSYGAHRALEDVSIHVDEAEICVILGANGAGKSTLLKSIAGLVHTAPGAHVGINGIEITHDRPNLIVEKGVALVPEGRGIFGDLTVAENLELGAYGRQARESRDARLKEVLTLFPKLAERRGQIARTMSGGEQQMVAIGRALMSNPKILMLDEPSLGLSPLLAGELFKSLKQVRDSGVGILLVEQNAKQSLAIADRVYLLENGHLTGEGRADVLANDPAVQRAYLGGSGKDVHRRLGDAPVVPASSAPVESPGIRPETAHELADRAHRIQRAHIEANRRGKGKRSVGVSGDPARVVELHTKPGEPAIRPDQAHALSEKAGEMARRAAQVLEAHVIAQRKAAAIEPECHSGAKKSKPKKSKKGRMSGKATGKGKKSKNKAH